MNGIEETTSTRVRTPLSAVLALLMLLAGSARIEGQAPPASQHGSVSQRVNTTTITVVYDRPVARGRTLFADDGVVMPGALWTPGANRATTIEFTHDVTVEGHAVPRGRYSVWTIPGDSTWTFILNSLWDTHHAIYPGDESDALRVLIKPVGGEYMEALAFYFPRVDPYETELRLHWGETVLPVRIAVGQ